MSFSHAIAGISSQQVSGIKSSSITPLLHITLPDDDNFDGRGEDRHFALIPIALEAMVAINLWHIRRSLRRAQLGLGNPISPLYMTGVRYKEDPAGREDWRDLYSVLERGYGDCVPLTTKVMREDRALVMITELQVGDRIWSGSGWTEVQVVVDTGIKPILEFELGIPNDPRRQILRCSPDHKLFLRGGEEIMARDVRAAYQLLTPTIAPASPRSLLPPGYWIPPGRKILEPTDFTKVFAERQIEPAITVYGKTEIAPQPCGDIKTAAGRYWLPESDVIVHNCDNLVAWRAAELQAAGINARPVIKWQHIPQQAALALGYPKSVAPAGGLWMVHCLVQWPNGKVEDPSKLLGMGGAYNNRM